MMTNLAALAFWFTRGRPRRAGRPVAILAGGRPLIFNFPGLERGERGEGPDQEWSSHLTNTHFDALVEYWIASRPTAQYSQAQSEVISPIF